ncbi:hypothetical protein ACTJJ0_14895 [Chitinophaga sp. 22321]|uniref:Uncharacterized protein n=1 Tax=Chitinophaga hostae TaxID=2831022 RepID=A0ABS5J1Y5_9BACT|nr:hypothetical protein [Chitinophaga hostae]MBS0029236.1 hypothetical protein [Chitinophaga hostae]
MVKYHSNIIRENDKNIILQREDRSNLSVQLIKCTGNNYFSYGGDTGSSQQQRACNRFHKKVALQMAILNPGNK